MTSRSYTNNNRSLSSLSHTKQSSSTSELTSAGARQRQTRKDEIIRRRAELDINKRKPSSGPSSTPRKSKRIPGTVSALKPSQALTVHFTMTITEAAQLMAAKRADCVLVINEDEHLSGIFTAKDLAFRVVAEGFDPRQTTVVKIMTPNPMCVTNDASATDALSTMVERGFRHLPVCNEDGDVVGILDITKCLYEALEKMNRAFGSSKKLYDALEGVEKEWALHAPQFNQLMENLKDQMSCPNMESIIDKMSHAELSQKATVVDAAKMMKKNNTTAVLIMETDQFGTKQVAGIFTSKDIILRVIAAGLDPSKCSIVRVMTPHPECAYLKTTILEALKQMHAGKFLNLPIMDNANQVIGVVDVLKLTYATLEQINSIDSGEAEEKSGPLWNRFWSSAFANNTDNDTESIVSDSHSQHHISNNNTDQIYPNESVSFIQNNSGFILGTDEFVYKLKTPNNKIYRFTTSSTSLHDLEKMVLSKIYKEKDIDTNMFKGLEYQDDDTDYVQLFNDQDLQEAVALARKKGWQRLLIQITQHKQKPVNTHSTILEEQNHQQEKINTHTLNTDTNKESDSINFSIPQKHVIPAALGTGFLVAAIVGVIVWRVSKQ